MSLNLNAATQKKDNGRVDDGSYSARIVQVIDLGVQHDTMWVNGASQKQFYVVDDAGKTVTNDDGYAKKTGNDTGHPVMTPKVQATFEFPTERIDIGGESKPRWLSKEYNVTSSGALAKLVEMLAPGSTNIGDILNKPCMVAIGSTSGGKAKIVSVSLPMKGMEVPELENPAILFDFDNPDKATWDNMLQWIKDKIKESSNYEGSALQEMVVGHPQIPMPSEGSVDNTPIDSNDVPY